MRNFSQAKIKTLRKEMMESLEVVARRHGVILEIGAFKSANWMPTTEIKAEIRSAIPNAQGAPQTVEATMWRRECRRHGFEESDLGKKVRLSGQNYTIRGIIHNRGLTEEVPVPPTVKLRRVADGKLRFFPISPVLHELRKSA